VLLVIIALGVIGTVGNAVEKMGRCPTAVERQ